MSDQTITSVVVTLRRAEISSTISPAIAQVQVRGSACENVMVSLTAPAQVSLRSEIV